MVRAVQVVPVSVAVPGEAAMDLAALAAAEVQGTRAVGRLRADALDSPRRVLFPVRAVRDRAAGCNHFLCPAAVAIPEISD